MHIQGAALHPCIELQRSAASAVSLPRSSIACTREMGPETLAATHRQMKTLPEIHSMG